MSQPPITADLSIAFILSTWPQTIPFFIAHRMICVGCQVSEFDTLGDALKNYGYPQEAFLQALNALVQQPAAAAAQEAAAPSPNFSQEPKMKPETYLFIQQVEDLLEEIPADSIVSRTFYEGEQTKAILFGFAPGQELSEHTSTRPAIVHFLRGKAQLTLGEDEMPVGAGAWAYMPANLKHSIVAEEETYMLLLLL